MLKSKKLISHKDKTADQTSTQDQGKTAKHYSNPGHNQAKTGTLI